MIGVDWGTTAFRAYRFRAAGLIDTIPRGPGLLAVEPGGFPAALSQALAPWLAQGERRILLAGMVGSRQGWVEAPYLPVPAAPVALAAAAIRPCFPDADVRLLPGLSAEDGQGTPEVMRGEEVQVFGALDQIGSAGTVCLPGTHSKWVRVEQGRIAGFTTHLTGEAFAALRSHTILARLLESGPDSPGAFARGLARARQPGGLLHHLFGVRGLGLAGRLPGPEAASYLSGLLIGHEVLAARPEGRVHLIGARPLCTLYAAAITEAGASPVILDGATEAGLARLGQLIDWDHAE